MKKPVVIHPFLFSAFPVLFFFAHNAGQCLSFCGSALIPTAVALGLTLLLLLPATLILKDAKKAGVIVSVLVILFFAYGHVFGLIVEWRIGDFKIGRHRYLLLAWGTLSACTAYFVVTTRRKLRRFTSILNVTALSLVVMSLLNIAAHQLQARDVTVSKGANVVGSGSTKPLRDIYYIILDGYASSSTLKEFYGYDNHEFTDYLSRKGFYVAHGSTSNYACSFLSLASSLNMRYINYLTDIMGIDSRDMRGGFRMIINNELMNFLKSNGYKFVHFSSGWGPTNHNPHADVAISSGKKWSEFTMMLIQTTMIQPFDERFGFLPMNVRKRLLGTFSGLAEVHRIEGLKFVFAHITCPHPPYVFGAEGEPVRQTQLKMDGYVWKQREKYLNQLIFVNGKVKGVVDAILSGSEVAPIIVFQADHGTASTFDHYDAGGWDHPTQAMLRERMRILNAYHLPGGGDKLLYDRITPVNTFRLILRYYFGTDHELLSDRNYYSGYNRPFRFVDVTHKLKYDSE